MDDNVPDWVCDDPDWWGLEAMNCPVYSCKHCHAPASYRHWYKRGGEIPYAEFVHIPTCLVLLARACAEAAGGE